MNVTQSSPRHNVADLLRSAAERHPDKSALVMPDGGTVSFAELWGRVCRISAGLRIRGFRAGDRMIVMIPMSIDLYTVMLGIIHAGGAAVFIDPWIGFRQIARFCAFAEPTGFAGIPKSHLLRIPHRALRHLPMTLTTGRHLLGFPAKLSLADFRSAAPDSPPAPVSPADSALITFTSGSSGIPKGANRTHGFLAAQHAALNREFPFQADAPDMTMFPVFALRNIANGVTSVIPGIDFKAVAAADGLRLFKQIHTCQVASCTVSPTFLDRLADTVESTSPFPASLTRILTGGAPVSDTQLRRWQTAFPNASITVAYGSTEAEPVAHISLDERIAVSLLPSSGLPGFCMGRPICGIRTRLISVVKGIGPSCSDPLPTETVGELLVSGDHVCRDYFRNPDAVIENKIIDPDGTLWHRMGDTGYFDAAGHFWLVGRVHSTIFRNGIPHHAQQIELAVRETFPDLPNAAVVGFPHPQLGSEVVLVIQSPPSDTARFQPLLARLADHGQTIDRILFHPRPFPTDPRHNAKTDYAKLRETCRHD